MQAEILQANPGSKIRIFAVNDVGEDSGIANAVSSGEVVPVLQDTPQVSAWSLWNVQWRDLVILDEDNNALGVFNLTDHDLSWQPEYDAVLDYLRLRAGE